METLRTSSYLIPVKLEDEEGKYMLIHGYTGAIDIVSESMLKKIQLISAENSLDSETVQMLLKRGYITTKTQDEEKYLIKIIANTLSQRVNLACKSFTLLVTYNCNFRCPYCYEQEKTKTISSLLISYRMIDNAFKTISQIESKNELHEKTINVFGGEPLLKENKERIKYIINKGKKFGFNFSAITNGYDLDCYADLLAEDTIRSIQITIDGSKSVHDLRRKHASEKHSFDKIMNNINIALKTGITVIIRINVDNTNLKEVNVLDDFFKHTNMYSYNNLIVYAAYIGGESNFNPKAYNETIDLSKNYDDFFNLFKKSDFKIRHNYALYNRIEYAIKNKKELPLSAYHCNAHYSTYIFDPFGNIYKCLDTVGQQEQSVGKYTEGILKWNNNEKLWEQRSVNKIAPCDKCKYALLCGGGCFAKKLQNSDSICDNFTIILKKVCNEIYSKFKPDFY